MSQRSEFWSKAKHFGIINAGILMMAVGIYFFKAPNGFATGGVSGLSILLAKIPIGIPQSVYMTVINILLLISHLIIEKV